ncbi:hypothetical protein CIB95_10390 [Lottiidibacillus patelloidae]|uniref:DUF1541 domain-containing protein n=1 Tax=Lottiidibacillus patelloidae TaxID=2670334 RepID=A0A263BSD8_9BACI|nr:YdhK family protein [Lottiidibacillus patelloidae]OZM56624.1 hypothetical protein CIB95_10390 [Lottiidibacillus patelloidae]
MKTKLIFALIISLFFVTSCSSNSHKDHHDNHGMGHHSDMIYEGSSEVPANLKIAENPKYPVGTKAISVADHMGGMMDKVVVTIVGAYETTAYGTTYVATTTGEEIKDHKWIVHEEFVNIGEEILQPGTKVATIAEHMKGMKGAIQTIEFSVTTTVYMVNFTATNGKKVTNHKWVTEEELEPLKD